MTLILMRSLFVCVDGVLIASQRLREAATEKAEAEKILLVKSAEADAESKYLNGPSLPCLIAILVQCVEMSRETGELVASRCLTCLNLIFAGMGIARQRRAIVEGLQTTVSEFSAHVPGTGPQDVMDLLLMTQAS